MYAYASGDTWMVDSITVGLIAEYEIAAVVTDEAEIVDRTR